MALLFVLTHSARPDLLRIGHTDGGIAQRIARLDRVVAPARLDAVHVRKLWDAPVIDRALRQRLVRLRTEVEGQHFYQCELRHALAQLREIIGTRGMVPVGSVLGRPLNQRIAREAELCWNCHVSLGPIVERVKCTVCSVYSEPFERLTL